MKNSQQYLKDNSIYPKLSFREPVEYKVKLIADKKEVILTPNDEKKDGMRYLVEHEGEKKVIITASISLIQQLAAYKENAEVTIRSFRRGAKLYFEVTGENPIPVVDTDEPYYGVSVEK